jgi:hypothetical protein
LTFAALMPSPFGMTDPVSMQTGPVAVLERKLTTMTRQPLSVLILVPCCWLLIALSDLAILAIPFRRLAPLTGNALGTAATVPLANARQQGRARIIGRAITIAARAAPFRSNCYPQALTAITLCRVFRVPTALFFGASFDPDSDGLPAGLKGHAWVVSGPLTITGGANSFDRFPALGCFIRLGR